MVQLDEVCVEGRTPKEEKIIEINSTEKTASENKCKSLPRAKSLYSSSTRPFATAGFRKPHWSTTTFINEQFSEKNCVPNNISSILRSHNVDSIDNASFQNSDENVSFRKDSAGSDSAIDLPILGIERTYSISSRISHRCCCCNCECQKSIDQSSVNAPHFTPRKLQTTVSLPVYANSKCSELSNSFPKKMQVESLDSQELSANLSNLQDKNSNNNHGTPVSTRTAENNGSSTSSRNTNARANTSFPTRTTDNRNLTSNFERSRNKFSTRCPIHNKGLIALLILLVVITISTLGTLIYFVGFARVAISGLDTTSAPEPPTIPEVQTVLNQTLFCGGFPEIYIPVESTLNSRNHISSFPFNPVLPVNDSRLQSRVVGGTNANIRQYPWQVSLWIKEEGMACGGTIVMKNWVITAAHCFTNERNPEQWEAYMGMSVLSQRNVFPAQRRDIIKIQIHTQYQAEQMATFDYDIALLKLESGVEFSDYIQPICIPPHNFDFPDFKKCYVSGWGQTSTSIREIPDVLQQAQVDIIPREICTRRDWLGPETVSERMLCAGKAEGNRDACQGDSGGPLSCYDEQKGVWTLAGSVSWGFNCGLPKFPGVYAKMSFFTEWIWNTIGRSEKDGF